MSTQPQPLTPEQDLFLRWKATRTDYANRYSTPERDQILFTRALEIRKNDNALALAVSHFDVALAEQDWNVVPLKQITIGKELAGWISSRSREQLVAEIIAAGPRSDLARAYAKACRDWGQTPVIFPVDPADATDTELDAFEATCRQMSTAEQKRRYRGLEGEGAGKGSFRWFSDLAEQRRLYREEQPASLTAAQYRAMPQFAITQRMAANERFKAAVALLRSRGEI